MKHTAWKILQRGPRDLDRDWSGYRVEEDREEGAGWEYRGRVLEIVPRPEWGLSVSMRFELPDGRVVRLAVRYPVSEVTIVDAVFNLAYGEEEGEVQP